MFPRFNENITRVGRCKVEGSTVSRPVHSCISMTNIELRVWTFIVWMVIHRTTFLDYEIMDVVSTKYVQFPIINMASVAIIEEHLGI